MYFCYIDESGTPDIPGTSSHYVLAGISLPVYRWRNADREVSRVLAPYGLGKEEFHTAWIMRSYLEQRRVPNFEKLDWPNRRTAVKQLRTAHLLALQRAQNGKAYKQSKKNYRITEPYVHLTYDERIRMVREVADCVAGWGFARIFAECIDKVHFNAALTARTIAEQAFEQVVSRFDRYLGNIVQENEFEHYGVLVHDNNQTVAARHTDMAREFHESGTLWTDSTHIVETPLFVDSSLTRMVQVADLVAYALRRYVENQETDLFQRIYQRADRVGQMGHVVGVRHFSARACACEICRTHTVHPQL